jgi:hypothetical protein
MTGRLMAEWLAYPDAGATALEQLGVTWRAAQRAGGLAIAPAAFTGRLWHPSAKGQPTAVLAVWEGSAPSIYSAVETPVVIDLIALHPADPYRFAYRVGGHDLLLGPVDVALAERIPVMLFDSPLEWLRAGALGVCLLEDAGILPSCQDFRKAA